MIKVLQNFEQRLKNNSFALIKERVEKLTVKMFCFFN